MIDIVLEEAEKLNQKVVPIVRGGGSDANYLSANGTPSICGMALLRRPFTLPTKKSTYR
ncbi:MAG: M20 family metallopeptidase [Bacteroidia bacterium]|nr:M20 family metallopeptidase [Bacteroidia bacterium]